MNREHPASEQASALDVVQKAVYRIWGGFYGKMFLVTFFLSILVHLYMFTNKFVNHDDVNGMFDNCSFGISSGRFLLEPLTTFVGAFSSPWFNGILGSFFLAIAVVAVLQLFDIKHWVSGSLIALTMVSFPTVASTFSYMFCSYQYLFALAMASIAAILIRKCRFLPALLGALLLAIGMGCYQAYFTFTVALLLLTYVFDLLDNRWQGKGGMALGVGVFYLVFLINAMILYMLILKICLLVQHKSLTGYQGIDEMGTLGATSFLTRIGHGYGALQPFYQRMLHEMIYVILAAFVLFIIYKIVANRLYRSPLSMVLLVVALGLLPLGCASIYLMTDIQTIHMVMLYALVLPTILPALMASKCHLSLASIQWKKVVATGCVCLLLLMQLVCAGHFVRSTNRAYLSMSLAHENVNAFYAKLTAKIELQENFSPYTPVAFIGKPHIDNKIPDPYWTGITVGDEAVGLYSYGQLLAYFYGVKYNFILVKEHDTIKESNAFKAMPCYPAAGSIQMIDDVLVVKFSDDE